MRERPPECLGTLVYGDEERERNWVERKEKAESPHATPACGARGGGDGEFRVLPAGSSSVLRASRRYGSTVAWLGYYPRLLPPSPLFFGSGDSAGVEVVCCV